MIRIRIKSICNDYRYDFEPTLIDSYRLGYLSQEVAFSYLPEFQFIYDNVNVDRNITGYVYRNDTKIVLNQENYLDELRKLELEFMTLFNTKTHYEDDKFAYYSKTNNDSFFSSSLDNILLFRNKETKITIITSKGLYRNFYDAKDEPIVKIEFETDTFRLVLKSPTEKQKKTILSNYFKLKENVKSSSKISD